MSLAASIFSSRCSPLPLQPLHLLHRLLLLVVSEQIPLPLLPWSALYGALFSAAAFVSAALISSKSSTTLSKPASGGKKGAKDNQSQRRKKSNNNPLPRVS